MSEWQPMYTAPKDGTRILILDPGHEAYPIEVVSWNTYGHTSYGDWENLDGRGFEPIGWMPLPAVPNTETK